MPTFIIEPKLETMTTAHRTHLDGIFQLRHEVFIKHLDWKLESTNGLETDCYDTDDTIYGIAIDWSGLTEGCFRLLPTTGPNMLADLFPEVLHGQPVPCDPRILESSRFAVLPSSRRLNHKKELIATTCRLLLVQLMYGIKHDIKKIVSVTDIRFERILLESGLICERFGPPVCLGEMTVVGGWLRPNKRNLESVSQVLGAIDTQGYARLANRSPRSAAAEHSVPAP